MFHIYVQKNGLNLKMDIEFASFVCLLIDTKYLNKNDNHTLLYSELTTLLHKNYSLPLPFFP